MVVDAGECLRFLRRHLPVGCMLPDGQRLWALEMAPERQGLDSEQLRGMGKEVPAPMASDLVRLRVAPTATNNHIRSLQRCCSG